MKAKKSTVDTKIKKSAADQRSRKMEPLKSKELKNQRFDLDDQEESEEMDPEALEENFKGFEENIEHYDDEDDDY